MTTLRQWRSSLLKSRTGSSVGVSWTASHLETGRILLQAALGGWQASFLVAIWLRTLAFYFLWARGCPQIPKAPFIFILTQSIGPERNGSMWSELIFAWPNVWCITIYHGNFWYSRKNITWDQCQKSGKERSFKTKYFTHSVSCTIMQIKL